MIFTGGIDDDDGKNNSPEGRAAVLVVTAAGVAAAVDVPANAVPPGAVPGDDATTAAPGGRVPPVGQFPTWRATKRSNVPSARLVLMRLGS
jgi:hypothetical protein